MTDSAFLKCTVHNTYGRMIGSGRRSEREGRKSTTETWGRGKVVQKICDSTKRTELVPFNIDAEMENGLRLTQLIGFWRPWDPPRLLVHCLPSSWIFSLVPCSTEGNLLSVRMGVLHVYTFSTNLLSKLSLPPSEVKMYCETLLAIGWEAERLCNLPGLTQLEKN